MKIKQIIFALFLISAVQLYAADDQSWLNALWQQVTELVSSVIEKTKQIFTGSSIPASIEQEADTFAQDLQNKVNQVGEKVVSSVTLGAPNKASYFAKATENGQAKLGIKKIKNDVQSELSKLDTSAQQSAQPATPVAKVEMTEMVITPEAKETEGIEAYVNQEGTKSPTDESKSAAAFTQADKQDLENQLNQQLPPIKLDEKPELIFETVDTKTVSVPISTPQQENRALLKELEELSETEKANVVE